MYLLLLLASSEVRAAPTSSVTLDLADLTDIALAHNGQIAISTAQISQAEALNFLAKAQAFPVGSITGLVGGPVPEARTTKVNAISSITPASLLDDLDLGSLGIQYRVNGQIAQPLYTFDKIGSLKRASEHLVRAAQHQNTVTQADVIVNVNKAFWTIQLTRTFMKSLDEGTKNLEGVLSKIEEMLEDDTGQVTENDRLRLKYALATLAVRRTEAEAIHEVAKMAMRLLIGWPQERALYVEPRELDELPEHKPKLEELAVWARFYRPELKALKEVVAAAETYTEFRKASFFPTIFLGAQVSYIYTTNATDQTNPFIYDPYNFYSVAVGVGMTVDLNIFTKWAQLKQANAEVRVRQAQSKFVAQLVDLEVRKLDTEIGAGYKRVEKLERANRTARGWLTASTLGYDIGTGRADELIDAFLAWAASEAELQTTRLSVLSKLVEMARATGKLVGPHAHRKN